MLTGQNRIYAYADTYPLEDASRREGTADLVDRNVKNGAIQAGIGSIEVPPLTGIHG